MNFNHIPINFHLVKIIEVEILLVSYFQDIEREILCFSASQILIFLIFVNYKLKFGFVENSFDYLKTFEL